MQFSAYHRTLLRWPSTLPPEHPPTTSPNMASQVMGAPPRVMLHTLASADGSATYISPDGGYKILAGVNYPVEVPYRSDELADSTFVEVNLRPHNGVGMVKERHVEQLIKRTLQAVIFGQETPRTMLQITLQVMSVENDESLPGGIKGGGQGETYLDMLAAALNAAVLGSLDAGVQMRTMVGATVIGLTRDGQVVVSPGVLQRKRCSSLHVFAFNKQGKTLLMESEGKFNMPDWKQADQIARSVVLGHLANTITSDSINNHNGGDAATNGTPDTLARSVMDIFAKALEVRVIKDESWRPRQA
jgi:exosome complex component RRP46